FYLAGIANPSNCNGASHADAVASSGGLPCVTCGPADGNISVPVRIEWTTSSKVTPSPRPISGPPDAPTALAGLTADSVRGFDEDQSHKSWHRSTHDLESPLSQPPAVCRASYQRREHLGTSQCHSMIPHSGVQAPSAPPSLWRSSSSCSQSTVSRRLPPADRMSRLLQWSTVTSTTRTMPNSGVTCRSSARTSRCSEKP